jgi:hypothetical protein
MLGATPSNQEYSDNFAISVTKVNMFCINESIE